MPHLTKFVEELGVVVIRHHGKVGLGELRTVLDELKSLPGFRPGLKLLSDFDAAEMPLTGDEIRALAEYALPVHRAYGATKWALIAPNTLTYGLARMYAALTHEAPLAVQVFKDAAEVDDWLELGLATKTVLAQLQSPQRRRATKAKKRQR
jgi:hypothetical protein